MATPRPQVQLSREGVRPWLGGSVTYRVTCRVTCRGSGFGGRYWWACWREDGDSAARASSELVFRSRRAALAWLLDRVDEAEGER